VRIGADFAVGPPAALCVWDVPVLEPGWSKDLSRRAKLGMVVALMGFADRSLVRQARAAGASACLDLPCDPADLVDVLDRLASLRLDGAHDVPPPATLRRGHRAVAEPGTDTYN
jgi:hypothetical protein